jgi:hypothetical protein
MSKLTDTQLVILSAASQRKDGTLLPFPKSIKLNRGALTAVTNSLLKQGLIAEQPAKPGAPHWREDKGQKFTLIITEKGMKAIGAEPAGHREPESSSTKPESKTANVTTKTRKPSKTVEQATVATGTKQALLIDLFKRKNGATIAEATKATGWQAHSVRGAISGTLKKRLGLKVDSETVDGRGRVYRISAGR